MFGARSYKLFNCIMKIPRTFSSCFLYVSLYIMQHIGFCNRIQGLLSTYCVHKAPTRCLAQGKSLLSKRGQPSESIHFTWPQLTLTQDPPHFLWMWSDWVLIYSTCYWPFTYRKYESLVPNRFSLRNVYLLPFL